MSAWTAEQERALAALGYTLYALAPVLPMSEGQATAPSGSTDGRLWQALLRAAGAADLSGLAIDLEALRRDPSRKRALWPRLRSLSRRAE